MERSTNPRLVFYKTSRQQQTAVQKKPNELEQVDFSLSLCRMLRPSTVMLINH